MGTFYTNFAGLEIRIEKDPTEIKHAVDKAKLELKPNHFDESDLREILQGNTVVYGVNKPSRGGGPRDITGAAMLIYVPLREEYLWVPITRKLVQATANLFPKLESPYEPSEIGRAYLLDAKGG